jgi:hypothetical protein
VKYILVAVSNMYLIKPKLRGMINKFLTVLYIFCISANLSADEPDPLFMSDEVIKIELRSDFTRIIGDRTEIKEYQPAELEYQLKKGNRVILPVRIKARGNFRLNPDNCSFPPLMINFENSNTSNTLFENQGKLKLVTPCQDEEDLLEEYVVYKMYNLVTDMSFRTRLVIISYYDTGTDKKLFTRYSFFIENEDRIAKRIDSEIIEKEITADEIERENIKKMSVFQYMIGNIDWNITAMKNIILMQPEKGERNPYAIPYDFDFSAFVDAKYTLHKGLEEDKMESRRVFRGICLSIVEYNTVFDMFRKLRPSFESEIIKHKAISDESKEKLIIFINSFYSVINNDTLRKQVFLSPCQDSADSSSVSPIPPNKN